MEYVSLAKSRAGYQLAAEDAPKKKTKASSPETTVTPAANTNHGGESASHTEEG